MIGKNQQGANDGLQSRSCGSGETRITRNRPKRIAITGKCLTVYIK